MCIRDRPRPAFLYHLLVLLEVLTFGLLKMWGCWSQKKKFNMLVKWFVRIIIEEFVFSFCWKGKHWLSHWVWGDRFYILMMVNPQNQVVYLSNSRSYVLVWDNRGSFHIVIKKKSSSFFCNCCVLFSNNRFYFTHVNWAVYTTFLSCFEVIFLEFSKHPAPNVSFSSTESWFSVY